MYPASRKNNMKSLMTLFVCLLGMFLGSWAYRMKTPINRPDEYAEGVNADAGNWLTQTNGKRTVDDEWILDNSIPSNYMPVPGQENLYMVIDNDGNIIKYRKRTRQIDGTWTWEDVNPDIPENYIPVEGLDNVYKVENPDGSVSYFKYIRNTDDTYAWIPVDEKGNYLDRPEDATVIDGKHVHITGNVYELLDDNGVVIGYDRRIQDADGKFKWVTADQPDLDKLTDEWKKNVEDIANSKNDSMDLGAQYESEADNLGSGITGSTPPSLSTGDVNINMGNPTGSINVTPDTVSVVNNADGTHTETTVVRETKTIDGWTSTYETRVENVYDSSGELISSRASEPTEVDRHPASSNDNTDAKPVSEADRTKKEATVDAEIARVSGTITYDDATATEVVNLLNAERAKNGLSPLQQTQVATSVAKIRAADMLTYDYTEKDLPTYGTLAQMLNDYSIASPAPGENLYKTTPKSAYDINTRFQVDDNARPTRMSKAGTQVGIAIAQGNGCIYVCEVIL